MFRQTLHKLREILGKKQTYKLSQLSVFLFFLGIFEFATILSIYPIINLIIGNTEIGLGLTANDFLFINLDENYVKICIALLILTLYTLKTFLFVLFNYRINLFLASLTATLSEKIYTNNLYDNYINHNEKIKSDELHIIQNETYNFFHFLRGITQIISEVILFVLVIIVLLIIEPLGILSIIFTFLIIYMTFYFLVVKKSKIWGEQRQKSDLTISKSVIEALSLFKEIKIYGLENLFLTKIKPSFNRKSKVMSKQITFEQLPRYFMEVALLICVLIYLATLYLSYTPIGLIISKSLVFVAASYKLLPTLNRIFSSLQAIKYYYPSIEVIYHRIKEKRDLNQINNSSFSFDFSDSILLHNLSFAYNQKEKAVLNNLNFKINKGDFVGLIGESGSGKSTLINILSGLIQPSSGKILIDGIELDKIKSQWQRKIAYVSQQTFLMNDSILNNVTLLNNNFKNHKQRALNALKEAGLEKFIKNLENGLDTQIGDDGAKISGGQKQRIGIARAIYFNPEVYIFDEITSSLDEKSELKIINTLIKLKGKKTVFFITHNPNNLSICDYEIRLENEK
jgi:ATP-binding cassette, subfamily B, bacterial PglK